MSDGSRDENIFEDLVPTAKRVLTQVMTGNNQKLAKETAESVLDRAGHARKDSGKMAQPIFITNSQVAILAKGAKEVEAMLEQDDLYMPDPEELERVARERE